MAFLPLRFTNNIKFTLVDQRLIHALFALTLTTYIVSHDSPPMFLWSKQCLPTLSVPATVYQHPARMILHTPRTSCDHFEIQAQSLIEKRPNVIRFTPHDFNKMFDFSCSLSPHDSPHNALPPKSSLGPISIEIKRNEAVFSNVVKEVTIESMPVHVIMVQSKRLKANYTLLDINTLLIYTVKSSDLQQVFEQAIQVPIKKRVESDTIQEIEQPQTMVNFKRWDTYIISNPCNDLRLWLQRLAPAKSVPQEEVPFREALIKILLSKEFQPFINNWWIEDEYRQEKRTELFYAYMKNVEWDKTPFKQLFLVQGSTDFHLVDLDAFYYGYKFPKRLGVHVYRKCDISCREDLL